MTISLLDVFPVQENISRGGITHDFLINRQKELQRNDEKRHLQQAKNYILKLIKTQAAQWWSG